MELLLLIPGFSVNTCVEFLWDDDARRVGLCLRLISLFRCFTLSCYFVILNYLLKFSGISFLSCLPL